MKSITFLSVLSALSLAGSATAQSSCIALATLVPACATGCISSAASVVGCSAGDYNCRCSPVQSASIQGLALGCVVDGCGIANALAASASARAVCNCLSSAATASSSTTSTISTTSSVAPPSSSSLSSTSTSALPPSSPTSPLPSSTAPISSSSSVSSNAFSSSVTATSSSLTGPITASPSLSASSSVASCANPCDASAAAIPACGQGCLLSAGSAVGCVSGDYACQCSKSAEVQASAANCVVASCGGGAIGVLGAANALCACVTASPATSCAVGITTTSVSTADSSSNAVSTVVSSAAGSGSSGVPTAPGGYTSSCSSTPANTAYSSKPSPGSSVSNSKSSAQAWTISTIYATTIYTISSCAPTVTNCPGKLGHLTTQTISLYTTKYPISGGQLVSSKPAHTNGLSIASSRLPNDGSKSSTSAKGSVTPYPSSVGGLIYPSHGAGSPHGSPNLAGGPSKSASGNPISSPSSSQPIEVLNSGNKIQAALGAIGAAFLAVVAF